MFQLESSYTLSAPECRICEGHVSSGRIVVATDGGIFHVFNIADCTLRYTRHDGQDWISALESFVSGSDENDEVLVVAQGSMLRMYNLATGASLHAVEMAHDKPVLKLKAFRLSSGFSGPTRLILLTSADQNGEIRLWDVDATGVKLRHILTGHNKTITYLALHPHDHNLLISGSHDSTIRVWNIGTGEQTMLCELEDEQKISRSFVNRAGRTITYMESVSSMTVTSDEKIIAGGIGGFVRVWNLRTSKLQTSWQAHNGGHPQVGPVLNKILLHPSGQAFITTGTDGNICLWDLSTYQLLRKIQPFEHSTLPNTIVWYGDKLVCAGKDGAPENVCGDFIRVIVWDLHDLQLPDGSAESWNDLSACQMIHAIYVVGSRIVMLVTRKGAGVIEVWKVSDVSN